jgi:phosphopantothenoylcysteine synthetase/decarboxylase
MSRSTRCATSPTAPPARRGRRWPKPCAIWARDVDFITGPAERAPAPGVDVVEVETAQPRWHEAVSRRPLPHPRRRHLRRRSRGLARRQSASGDRKLKKDPRRQPPALSFVENPDIFSLRRPVVASGRPKLVIGFAAETDDVVAARDGESACARAAIGSSPMTSPPPPASWAGPRTP